MNQASLAGGHICHVEERIGYFPKTHPWQQQNGEPRPVLRCSVKMPVLRVPVEHKFGILSHGQARKLLRESVEAERVKLKAERQTQ